MTSLKVAELIVLINVIVCGNRFANCFNNKNNKQFIVDQNDDDGIGRTGGVGGRSEYDESHMNNNFLFSTKRC